MTVVHTCDDHSSVYHHMRACGDRGLALTHLDAHCDMKGAIVDVDHGRAWLRQPPLPISASTYLAHLLADGIVADLEWIHDEIGGRENDFGTVWYTSDLSHWAHRFTHPPAGPGFPVVYRERDFAPWRYEDPRRVLDIDWDFFADWRKDERRTQSEIAELLDAKLPAAPGRVYVAFSSPYSRPGVAAYEEFVERLARRLNARVEPIPEAPLPRSGALARALPPNLRRLLRRGAIRLKQTVFR